MCVCILLDVIIYIYILFIIYLLTKHTIISNFIVIKISNTMMNHVFINSIFLLKCLNVINRLISLLFDICLF